MTLYDRWNYFDSDVCIIYGTNYTCLSIVIIIFTNARIWDTSLLPACSKTCARCSTDFWLRGSFTLTPCTRTHRSWGSNGKKVSIYYYLPHAPCMNAAFAHTPHFILLKMPEWLVSPTCQTFNLHTLAKWETAFSMFCMHGSIQLPSSRNGSLMIL